MYITSKEVTIRGYALIPKHLEGMYHREVSNRLVPYLMNRKLSSYSANIHSLLFPSWGEVYFPTLLTLGLSVWFALVNEIWADVMQAEALHVHVSFVFLQSCDCAEKTTPQTFPAPLSWTSDWNMCNRHKCDLNPGAKLPKSQPEAQTPQVIYNPQVRKIHVCCHNHWVLDSLLQIIAVMDIYYTVNSEGQTIDYCGRQNNATPKMSMS